MTNKSLLFAAIALTSCWKSGTTVDPRHPEAANVEVALASVTLGDDCNGGVAQERAKTQVAEDSAGEAACEQSSIVLSLTSTGDATTIHVTKVEVLDAESKPIATLASRKPSLWQGSAYMPWNQALAAKQTAQVSYDLPRFDWSKVPDGRYSRTPLTVRVTLAIGSQERTVEKQTQILAMPDPDVVT
jgi:hypothetical protein